MIDVSSGSVFELDLRFSGPGEVPLESTGNSDIRQLGQLIATYVL